MDTNSFYITQAKVTSIVKLNTPVVIPITVILASLILVAAITMKRGP